LILRTDAGLRRREVGASPHPASADRPCRQKRVASRNISLSIRLFRFLCLIAQIGALANVQAARAQSLSTPSDSLPIRKSGLWRISTLSPATGLHFGETCIRPEDSILGERDAACASPGVIREGEQVVVTIICEEGGQHVVTSLLLTGDFTTWYRAQGKITSQGATKGSEVHSGFTIDAKFLQSDCSEPTLIK